MVGRLHQLPRKAGPRRAPTSCSSGSTSPTPADRLVKTYSGGMRRRLDLAASARGRSRSVLFLDEPTTGPRPAQPQRAVGVLRDLVRDGTTLLLTTQYLEEADRLADDIVVLDHGRTVAARHPDELKAAGRRRPDRGHRRRPPTSSSPPPALARAVRSDEPAVDADGLTVTVPVAAGVRADRRRARARRRRASTPSTSTAARPTLDDVFLTLTGRAPNRHRARPGIDRR